MMTSTLPILYSFRRCPYAMRARLAIRANGVRVLLREVSLKSKPTEMLRISPKGTVPVLELQDGQVLEQSLDVMRWALGHSFDNSFDNSLDRSLGDGLNSSLIERNDGFFKTALDAYKYAVQDKQIHRAQGEVFLADLNRLLLQSEFLAGDTMGALDWAIVPFVRQFSAVDALWFAALPYPALQRWLYRCVTSDLFVSIMLPAPVWQVGDADVIF